MVDPANMNSNEKLAFWINVYNALIMHVSKDGIALFHCTKYSEGYRKNCAYFSNSRQFSLRHIR